LSPVRLDSSHDGKAKRLDSLEVVAKDTQIFSKLNLIRDCQAPVYSGQMILVIVRERGWTALIVAKDA
jgi:hypothetical protein